MMKNTIKWRIFKYNLIIIAMLILLVSIIFNVAIRMYLKNDIISHLDQITSRTVETALRQGPALFNGPSKPVHTPGSAPAPAPVPVPVPVLVPVSENNTGSDSDTDSIGSDSNNEKNYRYYFMLNRSLREPLSLLNAEYILLDKEKNVIPLPEEMTEKDSSDLFDQLVAEIGKLSKDFNSPEYLEFNISGADYIAAVRPLSLKNDFGLGWIIIYSSLQNVNQLQYVINSVLIAILIFSSIIALFLTSNLSKKISLPFYSLAAHIKSIAQRNFGTQIDMPVYEELQEVVSSINTMSEKLGSYDKAQKTFFQNVSHEFRTPLMSIQSYAEGIKYDVVDSAAAVDVILDETRRMTSLLEELLYLSRLETIEESYHFKKVNFNRLITCCIGRFNAIALKNNISILLEQIDTEAEIFADEEKLIRAITNIVSNCIRYAKTTVMIKVAADKNILKISIQDDGPGFEIIDLPNLFERYYKGEKGNLGLGLAISKNVIEKHTGKISAENLNAGGALFLTELPIAR